MESKDIEIIDTYEPLFELLEGKHPNVDTVIITGGRNSVKSYTVSIWALYALVLKNWRILYTRFTKESLEDSVKAEVDEKISLLEFDDYVTSIKGRIKLSNDSEDDDTSNDLKPVISFKGIHTSSKGQTGNLKSLKGFNVLVIDEADETPSYKVFQKVFLSIRSVVNRNISIMILNPTTREHWIYKRYYESKDIPDFYNGIKDNVMYIHTTYLDLNQDLIPKSLLNEFEDLKKNTPDEYYNVVMGGWRDIVEGVLIPIKKLNFININNIKLEDTVWRFSIADPANKGGDNYSMLFCWVVQQDNQFSIVVKDVIYSKDGIEALTDTIVQKLHDNLIEECYLEANGVGLASFLLLKKALDTHCQVKAFTTKENKEAKILANYESIIRYMAFDENYKSNTHYSEFIKHLTTYQKENEDNLNKHKMDAIDNASMAVKSFKIKFAKQLYS